MGRRNVYLALVDHFPAPLHLLQPAPDRFWRRQPARPSARPPVSWAERAGSEKPRRTGRPATLADRFANYKQPA